MARTTAAILRRTGQLVAAMFAIGCVAAPPPTMIIDNRGPDLRPPPPPPCTDALRIAHAAANDSTYPPSIATIFIPPLPMPPRVRGETAVVTVRVDNLGNSTPDSVTVVGLSDAVYAKKMRDGFGAMKYRPAQTGTDGGPACAVAGVAQLRVDLGR